MQPQNNRMLHLDATAPPHPEPLVDVIFGSIKLGILARNKAPLEDAEQYRDVLADALKLSIKLILHPFSFPQVIRMFAASESAHPTVACAIRRVLNTTRWVVCLDEKMPNQTAHTHRKVTGDVYQKPTIEAFVLQFNMGLAKRLLAAHAFTASLDMHRHLFFTAQTLGHELIHAMRLQIRFALIPYPEIQVNDPSPSKAGAPDLEGGEAGWEWEESVCAGRLMGAWLDDGSTPPLSPNIMSNDILRAEDYKLLMDEADERAERKLGPEGKPFDMLVRIAAGQKGRECNGFEIKDDWIARLIEGTIDCVTFPPPFDPEALDNSTIKTLYRDSIEGDGCASSGPLIITRRRG